MGKKTLNKHTLKIVAVNDFYYHQKSFYKQTTWISFKLAFEWDFAHQPVGGDVSPVITAESRYLAVPGTLEGLYNTI